MAADPPPPIVTVYDPNDPGSPDDFLRSGDARRRWWPRRRNWLALLALVLAVAVTSSVLQARRERAAERRRDSAAAAAVQLETATDQLPALGDDRRGTVLIGLLNDGPDPVTVQSVQVLAAGYREQRVSLRLTPSEVGRLHVADTAACTPDLALHLPEQMRLRLRTSRGQSVTRTLNLVADGGPSLQLASQQRCGSLPPQTAFKLSAESSRRVGRDLVVRASASNHSRLPLRLLRLEPGGGLTLSTSRHLPLALPTAFPDVGGNDVELTLTWHVISCREARSQVDDANSGVVGALRPGAVHATVQSTQEPILVDLAVVKDFGVYLRAVCG